MISSLKNIEPRISILGAGPGDPGLITVKGAKALQHADVVLYDALVNKNLLDYTKKDCVKVYVGKRAGKHSFSQDEINDLMVKYAQMYGYVVRLKGGDPFVFGRGYEELKYAMDRNIPVCVIPGISSSISVPELQGIPLTTRGYSESFCVLTASNAKGELTNAIKEAVQTNATIVILMGFKKLTQIVKLFKAQGKNELPVAVIENGSAENERIILGQVNDIVERSAEFKISGPTLMVFGEVVKLHQDYHKILENYAYAN